MASSAKLHKYFTGHKPHTPIIREGEWSLWKSGVHGRVFFVHHCATARWEHSIWVWETRKPRLCAQCGQVSGLIPKHLFRIGKMIEGLGDHSDTSE